MAFDVGAVVAHLTLDKKQWEQSIAAVKGDQKSLTGFILNNEQQIKKFGKALTIVGAAITGAFGLLIKGAADAGDYINDLSIRTGIGAETLSAYKLAADKSGTSLEGLAIGMRGLANQMQSANDGGKESQRIFDSLGITYVDNTGKLRPLGEVMLDVADRFAGMEDGARKTALAQDIFGRSGMELIPMINMGRKGLEENAEAAKKLGIVWSQEAAAKADEFNDSMAELKAGLAGTGREIATVLMPTVKALIENVRDIAVKVREWVAEHPTLTSWIAKLTLGMGLLMGAIGPILVALPGLVKGFQAFKSLELGSKITGQFKGLGDDVTSLSGVLGKLPAIGAAAFAGWNIGKLIGDLTGLNSKIEGLSTTIINKFGLWQGSAELVASSTDRVAKQQDLLKQATAKAGIEVTNVVDAIKVMNGTMIVQDGHLVRVATSTKDVTDKTKVLGDEQKRLGELMEEYGILPLAEKQKKISELVGFEATLNDLLKKGQIDVRDYGEAIKKADAEILALRLTVTTTIPPARDLTDIWKKAPATFDDAAYGAWTFEDALKGVADQAMVSENTVLAFLYNTRSQFLATMGIMVPQWESFSGAAQTAATTTHDAFAGVLNDIATKFGDTFARFVEEGFNFKTLWEGLWTGLKDIFFRALGEMVTGFVSDFLGSLVKNAAKAAGDVASSVLSASSSAVKGISDVLSGGLATAIGTFAGTFLAGVLAGGPSAHQQQQQINDIKDSRNFLADIKNWMFSAGSGFGGAIWDFLAKFEMEKFDGLKASVDLSRDSLNPKVDEVNGWLRSIDGRGGDIARALGDLKSAAGGAVSTKTELVAVHGTPSNPEYIIPSDKLGAIAAAAPASGEGKSVVVNFTQEIHFDGQFISDKDFTRGRIIPELREAFRSGAWKAEIQQVLGVA
jgi:TP901 family phage tail tape measure protein